MQNKQNSSTNLIDQLSAFTPLILFVTMILLFFILAIFQNHFYSDLFQKSMPEKAGFVGLVIPLVIQVLRLTSGLLSASFFKEKRFLLGVLVFAFSIWISLFEHNEVKHMAEIWGSITVIDENNVIIPTLQTSVELSKNALSAIMQVMIWSALVLELFLAFWLGGQKSTSEKKQHQNKVIFSQNGSQKNGNQKMQNVQN